MAKITIPYAVADFVNLRERGFYYVDKTDYIPKLEDYNAPILLRPLGWCDRLLLSRIETSFWEEYVDFYFGLLL